MAFEYKNVDELIQRVGELPPMPEVAQKGLALIQDPKSTMAELADVLALDEALASLVLRWVNSPYYGLIHPVSSVRQAVVYLGHNTIRSLILAASIAAYMDRAVPGYGLERGELWKHAVGVAAGARLAVARFGPQVAEEAYHAGLLCDIGKLAFEILLRGVDTTRPEWRSRPFSELEVEVFGMDHATLGAEMARRWHLPQPLIEAIACHHRPSQETLSERGSLLAAAVHVADAAVMMMGIGLGYDGLQYALDPLACERLGWTEANFHDLVIRVGPLIAEAEAFIQLRRNKFI